VQVLGAFEHSAFPPKIDPSRRALVGQFAWDRWRGRGVIRKLLIEKGEHGGGGADGRHEPPKIKHEEESPRVGAPVNPAPGPKGDRLSVAIYQRRADAPAYFQFKVVASDAPSNAHDVTRANERMSALVLLDATPPELAALAAEEGSLHCLATNAVSRLVAVPPSR
jgi:hypothetical protein